MNIALLGGVRQRILPPPKAGKAANVGIASSKRGIEKMVFNIIVLV